MSKYLVYKDEPYNIWPYMYKTLKGWININYSALYDSRGYAMHARFPTPATSHISRKFPDYVPISQDYRDS